jgi:hypothetical protein
MIDRAEAINVDDPYAARIQKIVAFGGITTKHDGIQDIDLAVEFEPRSGNKIDAAAKTIVLRKLKERSSSLKMHVLDRWVLTLPGRVVWKGKAARYLVLSEGWSLLLPHCSSHAPVWLEILGTASLLMVGTVGQFRVQA